MQCHPGGTPVRVWFRKWTRLPREDSMGVTDADGTQADGPGPLRPPPKSKGHFGQPHGGVAEARNVPEMDPPRSLRRGDERWGQDQGAGTPECEDGTWLPWPPPRTSHPGHLQGT